MQRLLTGTALAARLSIAALPVAVFAIAAPAAAESPMTPMRPTSPSRDPSPASSPPPAAVPPVASPVAVPVATGVRPAPAGAVKLGSWEFSSELQASPEPSPNPPPRGVRGATATYTSCITADNAVPANLSPQCRLDSSERHGSRIAWSMTCAKTQVRAEGVARYSGDTMEATMVSRLTGADGAETAVTQRIAGRYLGPCVSPTNMPPSVPEPAEAAPPSPEQEALAPPSEPAARDAGRGRPTPRYKRDRHARRGAPVFWADGPGSSFGPNPYSDAGP